MDNNWWLRKAELMKREADKYNSAGFLKSLKEVYELHTKTSSSLLSNDGSRVISKPSQLMDRWKEVFNTLLNAVTGIEEDIFDRIPPFPQQISWW